MDEESLCASRHLALALDLTAGDRLHVAVVGRSVLVEHELACELRDPKRAVLRRERLCERGLAGALGARDHDPNHDRRSSGGSERRHDA